jgi:hypothetical protein
LPLPELGAPPGLDGLFFAVELLEPEPEVPPAPDGLELPDAEVPPPDDEPPCRSQPAIRVPLRANANAAANAVSFMLTSMGCVP